MDETDGLRSRTVALMERFKAAIAGPEFVGSLEHTAKGVREVCEGGPFAGIPKE